MQKRLTLLALATIVAVSSTGLAMAADEPSDTIDVAELDLDTGTRAFTLEYTTRDSDGDGWTDWYERLDGTDPNDPASFPGGVRVDVIDTTVFVQSMAFPDRFVAIDGLELPKTENAFGDLTDLVGSITSATTLGKFRDELVKEVSTIAGDVLGDIVSDVDAQHDLTGDASLTELGQRTNGKSASLISWELGGGAGSNSTGASVSSESGSVSVNVDKNGVTTTLFQDNRSGGYGSTTTTVRVNGKLDHTVTSEYAKGKVVKETWTDSSGTTVNIPSTSAPAPATTIPTETTTPASTETTVAPTETSAPPTTVGGYTNPDADPTLAPTAAEIEARVAFLGGVRAQYLPTIDLPAELDKDKPGVADPAEPECQQDGCVAFTVVLHPELGRADGACPRTFCNSDPRLGGAR